MTKKAIFLLSAFIMTFISNAQVVTTLAGSTGGFADGTGAAAKFYYPYGVATDAAGNVYVADTFNNKIRKITQSGEVSTFAGSTYGFADGIGAAAQFIHPYGVATDNAGNLYVADSGNSKIRKITPAGVVSTLAGSTPGSVDGVGTIAQFNSPTGVATDAAGNVYVADLNNNKIRKITPAGVVTTLAGSGIYGFANGTGMAAQFNYPLGVATDAAGNVYVADSNNNKIRKITPMGVVSTLAGSSLGGFADGTGALAMFKGPIGVATDAAGNVYVGDQLNNRIRKITPAGVVSTLAGRIQQGFADGAGDLAMFDYPYGVATDTVGNVYVADQGNNKIRKIDQTLSVAQNEVASKITIYPNPVTAVLTVKLENGCVLDKIIITDLSGKVIITKIQNTATINIDNLPIGMYIIEAYSGDKKIQSKFIKQ